MTAFDIEWDVSDEDIDTLDLPTVIEIPEYITCEEEISDYLTEVTGFCHHSFELADTKIDGFSFTPPKRYKTKSRLHKAISIIIRAIISLTAWVICDIFMKTYVPEFLNKLAVEQLQEMHNSDLAIYSWSRLMNYLWLIPLFITLALFMTEIRKILEKIDNYFTRKG